MIPTTKHDCLNTYFGITAGETVEGHSCTRMVQKGTKYAMRVTDGVYGGCTTGFRTIRVRKIIKYTTFGTISNLERK